MKTFKQFIIERANTTLNTSFMSFNEIQNLLIEAATTDATRAEMAICVAYNMKPEKGMSEKEALREALKKAGIAPKKWAGVSGTIKKTGKLVANNLTGFGDYLVHSGTGSVSTYYKSGSDTTPKTDLYVYGSKNHRCSLKKSGDKGEGAQLMSAKGGEASGVFTGGLAHFKKNTTFKAPAGFNAIIKKLKTDMNEMIDSELYVEIGKSKTSFVDWYVTKNSNKITKGNPAKISRYEEIETWVKEKMKNDPDSEDPNFRWLTKKTKKVPTETQAENKILDHMKHEIQFLGATAGGGNLKKIIHPDIQMKKRTELEKYIKAYEKTEDEDVEVGDIMISKKYIDKLKQAQAKGASPAELKSPELKKKVGWILRTAMDGQEIQEQIKDVLGKDLEGRKELKQWIVYEAASGLYKFTGQASNNKDYKAAQTAVANEMLVFTTKGVVTKHGVLSWSKGHSGLVDNLNINFKGSGKSRWLRLGIATDSVIYTPPPGGGFLYESKIIYPECVMDNIIDEEYADYEKTINEIFLAEGIGSWLKGKFNKATTAIADKVKKAVRFFYEKVIKRFIAKLVEWAEKGVFFLAKIFGWEIGGETTVNTPSW